MDAVIPGRYRHYKGKEYEVIGIGRTEQDLGEVVIYRALYKSDDFGDNAIWVRPLSSFLENVEVNGKKVPRFTRL